MSTKNEKYSAAEKAAYHAGRAWARGKAKQNLNVGDKNKQSFRNGVKAERERMKGGK
jgi:hypothetical protein